MCKLSLTFVNTHSSLSLIKIKHKLAWIICNGKLVHFFNFQFNLSSFKGFLSIKEAQLWWEKVGLLFKVVRFAGCK